MYAVFNGMITSVKVKRVSIKKGKGVRDTNSFVIPLTLIVYHPVVRLVWYQKRLVLDDSSREVQVLIEMQALRMRFLKRRVNHHFKAR